MHGARVRAPRLGGMTAIKGFGHGGEGALADRQRAALNLKWGYGWSADRPGTGFGEFVPMVWGGGDVDDALATIRRELPTTKAKHLLGFNEPDFAKQSRLPVERAVELWPRLEELGLRLGAPATIKPNATWSEDFMREVDRRRLRVDFVPVHVYGWPNADDFLGKLQAVHAKYGRPVWVTEYAVADFKAETKRANRYTPAQVERFMRETVAGMREMSFVERFAWKTRRVNDPEMWVSALFQDDGSLTSRGKLYASL